MSKMVEGHRPFTVDGLFLALTLAEMAHAATLYQDRATAFTAGYDAAQCFPVTSGAAAHEVWSFAWRLSCARQGRKVEPFIWEDVVKSIDNGILAGIRAAIAEGQ